MLQHEDRFLQKNFNSIKVRLELAASFSTSTSLSTFQFHKGTIRTNLGRLILIILLHFNSIKVRLEHVTMRFIKRISVISIP